MRQKEEKTLVRKGQIWLLVGLLLLGGCSSRRLWEESKPLPDGVWHRRQPLVFHFLIRDAQQPYHIFLHTRYEASYPYHNMYVSYALSDIHATVLGAEMREVQLFEPRSGKPIGSGSSNLFFKADTLLSSYRFVAPGRYTLKLRQFMRLDSLVGVRDIALRVDRVSAD